MTERMRLEVGRVRGLGVVTPRDRELLVWMGRFGVTTVAQAARWWFGGSAAMATRRLKVLEAHSLVRRAKIYHGRLIYLPTTAGARIVNLRPPRLSGLLPEVDHSLLCADVLMSLQQQWSPTPEDEVSFITERELRVERLRDQRQGNTIGWRCPDGLVIRNGVRIGIEVEKHPKRSVSVRRIATDLLPYLGENREFRGVLWLLPSRAIARRYESVFAQLNAADVFKVAVISEVIR